MNTNTNMINNTKEENKMKYRITAVNGKRLGPWHYATLCPICGKHYTIACNYEDQYSDTDVQFMHTPRCALCAARFVPLYCATVPGCDWFDGHLDIVTGKYIASCYDLSEDFVYASKTIVDYFRIHHKYADVPEGVHCVELPEDWPF